MISNPHSNSYLDLNGDCIPDIFLTKEKVDADKKKSYYGEIYLQKLFDGNNKYCLSQTDINFIGGANTLIGFDDMDRDSMPDMHFYHEEKIYIFINQHKSKPIETGVFKGNENLCIKPENVTIGHIFKNTGKLNESIIEDLKPLFKESDILGLVSQFENKITD